MPPAEGEENSGQPEDYECFQNSMIADWRRTFAAYGSRSRRREFRHSAAPPSPSLLKHILKGTGGVQQNDSLATVRLEP